MTTHKTAKTLTLTTVALTLSAASLCVNAQQSDHWYLKPGIGISSLSDTSASASNADLQDSLIRSGSWDINTDSGFYAGLGLGYEYSNGVRAEVYWEYRTNDSSTAIYESDSILEGNLASSVIFANGYYPIYRNNAWQLFVGAGLGWVQELDIDLEEGSFERSYSGDGELAYQLMTQLEYQLSKTLSISSELRWLDVSSPSLDAEEGGALGVVDNFDYNPISFGVSIQYRF